MSRPIKAPPPRLRQRARADGAWRIWWEPETPLRELGFAPVELDPARLTWSVREAARLNDLVAEARGRGTRPAASRDGRTIKALVAAYRASPKWDALRPATRVDYARAFVRIEEKWGASLVVDFSTPIVLEWYETLYARNGPSIALAMIRKLSILMAYAKRKGWREDNPCRDLDMTTPRGRSRVADWAELDALLVAATPWPSMACAIALAVWQGQRQTDILEAETAAFRDAVWAFRRSKRGNLAALDLNPEALPHVEAMLAEAGDRRFLLHSETTGAPYRADHFRHLWMRIRAEAAKTLPGIATLQFRDLRRTFGHLARLGGASERDVADALGNNAWKDPDLSARYMPANADTASRAVAAVRRPK